MSSKINSLCCKCRQHISTEPLRAVGRLWHSACFQCTVCKKCVDPRICKEFLDGKTFFTDSQHNLYCANDYQKKFSVCVEVEKNLFLGNKLFATNGNFLKEKNIRNVLSVLNNNLANSSKVEGIQYKFYNIFDTEFEDIISYFPDCYQFITSSQLKGENIFIHCMEGISRSASLVLSFLMKKYGYNLEKAVQILKECRKEICPNVGFVRQLKLWFKMRFILMGSDQEYRLVLLSALKYRLLIFKEHRVVNWKECVGDSFKDYNKKLAIAENNIPELNRGTTYWCKCCLDPMFYKLNLIKNIGSNLDSKDGIDICPTVFVEPPKRFLETILTNATTIEQLLNGKIICLNCGSLVGIFNWALNSFLCCCEIHKGVDYHLIFRIDLNKLLSFPQLSRISTEYKKFVDPKVVDKKFYEKDGKPYCETDIMKTFDKCCVCQKPITDRKTTALGKNYHSICFVCSVCKKSLDGQTFHSDPQNNIYCVDDYQKKFAPKCVNCNLPILPEPNQKEAQRLEVFGNSYHINCFKCEECKSVLNNDTNPWVPLGKKVLCKKCFRKKNSSST